MLVMMLGQTRIFLGMAKDGLIPKFFRDLHPNFKTPHKSTVMVGAIISIVAAFTPIDKVSEMCSMGTLLAFAMVCVAVMILRVKKTRTGTSIQNACSISGRYTWCSLQYILNDAGKSSHLGIFPYLGDIRSNRVFPL
jgi:amino acid transporter